jgi:hypothetical protein
VNIEHFECTSGIKATATETTSISCGSIQCIITAFENGLSYQSRDGNKAGVIFSKPSCPEYDDDDGSYDGQNTNHEYKMKNLTLQCCQSMVWCRRQLRNSTEDSVISRLNDNSLTTSRNAKSTCESDILGWKKKNKIISFLYPFGKKKRHKLTLKEIIACRIHGTGNGVRFPS